MELAKFNGENKPVPMYLSRHLGSTPNWNRKRIPNTKGLRYYRNYRSCLPMRRLSGSNSKN